MLSLQFKEDCPHIKSKNLVPVKKFKSLPFAALKCKNCEEMSDLWICLFCGEIYCSRYINSHFIEHNNSNQEHCLCLGIMDLSVWCYECIDDKNNQNNNNEKGCYIKSKITDEYIRIYEIYFIYSREISNEKYKKEIQVNKTGLC